jgi:hypothetical protein
MSEDRIRGKVARLLNARELALNIGSERGVYEGMRFAVLNPRGEDIIDPDTGSNLGSVEVPKVLLEVTHVAPHACVARTYKTRTTKISGGLMSNIDLFSPPKYRTTAEIFRTADNQGRLRLTSPIRS